MKIDFYNIIRYKLFRFLIIFLIAFLGNFSNDAVASKNFGVSGQVKDEHTNKAIEFCSVRIFNMSDSLITGAVTDSKGFFLTSLPKGKYTFLFEYLGYLNDTSVISVFQHHRRKSFPDDFARIKERLISGYCTAIYWHSIMFVSISKSANTINQVVTANKKYAATNPVGVIT